MRKRAFTLTELLAVMAILLVVAAVSFPVFASAKASAQQTVCSSNFKQAAMATLMYTNDYDDGYMPVNYQPGVTANALTDRTWVQLLLPYTSSFSVFECPADSSVRQKSEAIFDEDLTTGDSYERFYSASMRTNLAYNYLNLAPVVRQGNTWQSMPKSTTAVSYPAATLLFVDSVYSRNSRGMPYGGGSWLVVPPCRYEVVNNKIVDTVSANNAQVYTPSHGWQSDESAFVYGGAWPWHNGLVMVARADGSVAPVKTPHLTAGCNFEPEWGGVISDAISYQWDAR